MDAGPLRPQRPRAAEATPRFLVVGDRRREGLCSALARHCRHADIRVAGNAAAALRMLTDRDWQADLILLDLRRADADGSAELLRLRHEAPGAALIVVAAGEPRLLAVLAEEVAGRAARGRAEPHPPAPPPADAGSAVAIARLARLTPQQRRILALICAGRLNKQIAFEMGLAEATVKAHITGLLRRLRVQSRTQAAVLVAAATGSQPSP